MAQKIDISYIYCSLRRHKLLLCSDIGVQAIAILLPPVYQNVMLNWRYFSLECGRKYGVKMTAITLILLFTNFLKSLEEREDEIKIFKKSSLKFIFIEDDCWNQTLLGQSQHRIARSSSRLV